MNSMEEETIEQRRQRNIQNNFLKLIELGFQLDKDEDKNKKVEVTVENDTVKLFDNFYENVDNKRVENLLSHPQRTYQINQVYGLFLNTMLKLPALICEGPSGSGKSEIVQMALQSLPYPSVNVSCIGYRTVTRLLSAIWFAIKSSIKTFCQNLIKNNPTLNPKTFDSVFNLIATDDNSRTPTKFVQLTKPLNALLTALFDKLDEHSTAQCFFHIVIDKLDEVVCFLDDNTGTKLLELSTLCHSRIKVIALMRNASVVREGVSSFHLVFPSYSSEEISSILMNKLKDCIKKCVTAELSKRNSVRITPTRSSSSSTTKIHTATAACNKVIVSKFEALVKTSILFVGRIAYNITTLWDFSMTLWKSIYEMSLDLVIQSIIADDDEADKVSRKEVTHKSIESAILSQLQSAYWDVNMDDGATALNNNWGKPADWISYIPKRQICLMIAVFLASNNPKESDIQKLTDEKSGRRKRQRQGVEDNDAGQNQLSGSLKTGKGLQFRSISLERLVSVFLVVTGTTFPDKVTPRVYGNAECYTMITSLVAMKYLTPLPSWNVKNPHYISHITHDMALELSAQIRFNLAAYMVSTDTNCPL